MRTGFLCEGLRFTMSKASAEVLRLREEGIGIEEKGPLDTVTAADKKAEAILTNWVATELHEDGILAEEGTTRASRSGRIWYFDPVDGTKNFTMRPNNPFFGISAGRGVNGQAIDGGLCFPATGEFFFATRGEGAWIGNLENEHSEWLTVPPFERDLEHSVVSLGLTKDRYDLHHVFKRNCWNALAIGSFVWEAMMVVRGEISAYVHTGATQFDCAAAALIAEEAGCAVSRLDGKPIDLRETVIPVAIAANASILSEVLELCNR